MVTAAGLHVDIVPAKTEGLSPAHAGHGQQAPEGVEAIVGDVTEEGR